MTGTVSVEQWNAVDLELTGDESSVVFDHDGRQSWAESFRTGGRRLVRFAPDLPGDWDFRVLDDAGAAVRPGRLSCAPAGVGNHGPVIVDGLRFRYADRTPYTPVGSTALRWHLADATAVAATVDTLKAAPFSKIRMSLPGPDGRRPDAGQLDRAEQAVRALLELGIGAELVLFDPPQLVRDEHGDVDPGWREQLHEAVARFAGFRNVSWCVAVDADLDRQGRRCPDVVWDQILRELAECDHGRRLRTIQAGIDFDFGRHGLTHLSLRHDQPRICSTLTSRYRKPVIIDALGMEGDAEDPAGSRTGPDLLSDIWETICRGGYGSHGEWFDNRWWEHGGELVGTLAPRLDFLRQVIDDVAPGIRYGPDAYDASTLELDGEYYLQYLGAHRFRTRHFTLPTDARFTVELLDTWNLTVERVATEVCGDYELQLPGRPYTAIRIRRW